MSNFDARRLGKAKGKKGWIEGLEEKLNMRRGSVNPSVG